MEQGRKVSDKNEKTIVSTNTKTEEKTDVKPDGLRVKTITTITTEKYSDGTTATKAKVETLKEVKTIIPFPPEKSISVIGVNLQQCIAPRAELTTDDKFIQESLRAHNDYRARHGASPLVLNQELGKTAQARANHNAAQDKMEHGHFGLGENIYWVNKINIDGLRAVKAWYSEIDLFNWNVLEAQNGTGHFIQLIWKGSKEVGIARAVSPKGYTYVVANYNPPGNWKGKYPENISKLIS